LGVCKRDQKEEIKQGLTDPFAYQETPILDMKKESDSDVAVDQGKQHRARENMIESLNSR
jgi:hypothetical protein